MEKVGIGIIGCGNISGAYLTAMKSFPILDIRGVADLNRELAEAKAAEFGLKAVSIDALFADPTVEIIVNLTVPKAHVAVALQAIDAGKHTYSEKPLGINFVEGKKLADAASTRGLRIGAAPDTFLGGGHQAARAIIDEGAIGQPVGGTATFMCPGHERWHPNPDFYYEVGGGPMLDMGPYYITDLVNRYTKDHVRFVIGLSLLIRVFEYRYSKLPGSMLEALSHLLAQNVRIYAYPMSSRDLQQAIQSISATGWQWTDRNGWVSADLLRLASPVGHLFNYVLASNFLVPMPIPAELTVGA